MLFASSVIGEKHTAVNIQVGEVRIIEVPDVEQVAIGNEKVFSYRPLENGEFVLIGNIPGRSSLHIWQKGGRQRTYTVNVISSESSGNFQLARYLASTISGLNAYENDGKIIFSGDISVEHKENFLSILSQFDSPISLVTYSSFELAPVVRLDVMLLEIKQRAVKDLGIDWDDAISGPVLGVRKIFTRNDYFSFVREGPNETNGGFSSLFGEGSTVPNDYNFYKYSAFTSHIGSIINLLQESGDAKVISAPKLMAKSGESASFLSGGEFPVSVVNTLGQSEIEFKEYGVRLDIAPTVDDRENINTFIFTELSSIDFANAVNGVPGLIARNSETTINLRSGETFAISGLSLAEKASQERKLPLLGDIPVLGNLFKNDSNNSDSTELVILVTPYILTPKSKRNEALIEAGSPLRDEFKKFNWRMKLLE
nr:pilus assembly protein N-terminal domain-containing protein [Marinibactrum halimedae]